MNYMYNGHADVTALLNQDGIVTATYYYDAFGNIIEQTGNANNSITYAGYQYDGETGLYYLNARMYDPKIARFLQEDTYLGDRNDPLSLNLYTYCHNEPVMYWDPSGHKAANLNDLALAAGAKKEDIIWNGRDEDHPNGSATVTVNGITHTFTVGKDGTYIKDNRIVIDNNVFDSKFKNNNISISTVVTDKTITASRTVITGNNTQTSLIGSHNNNFRKDTNQPNGNVKESNSNVEIRVVDFKEFNQIVWTDWIKNHEDGKGMTMSEYNAVYNVYSAGLRESDFANYSDYEKVVYLAAVEVYENKYNMTPEEFLMVMFGVIAKNKIKVKGSYARTESGDIRYVEGKPNTGNGQLLLTEGKIGNFVGVKNIRDFMSRVPSNAQRLSWKELPGGAKQGIRYKWTDASGNKWEVRAHEMDPSAPNGSNASQGWIYRVEVKPKNVGGKWYMDSSGNFHKENILNESSPFYNETIANNTHIKFSK